MYTIFTRLHFKNVYSVIGKNWKSYKYYISFFKDSDWNKALQNRGNRLPYNLFLEFKKEIDSYYERRYKVPKETYY
jgi:hypothetical protein